VIVLALALAASGVSGTGYAQRRGQPGQSLPQPTVLSVFPTGVSAGDTVDVTVRGTDLEGATSLWFDHPGLRAFHLKGLTFRVVCATGTPVGHHDLRAVGTYGVSNPRTIVVGDRPEANEVEPNNSPAQATTVTVNSAVNGEVGAADIDCFGFNGKKGQRLLFDVEAERIDSRLDATLRLLDPAGREIAESRDATGPDPFLDVTLPADGRYTLKLHDVLYQGSSDHVYRLTVTDGPHLDAVVPVVARAGEATTFTLIGRNLGGEPAPDLTVDGRPLERKTVTLTPPASPEPDPSYPTRGFVPAPAATRRGFEYALGSPSGSSNPLFIAEAVDPVVVEQEPNDDNAGAQKVDLPCDISGCFGRPGDLDVYRLQARKGEIFWIEASAERIGSPADPVFVLQKVNEKGETQELTTGDDTAERGDPLRFPSRTVDASVRWTVPEDGLYQVAVSDLYGSQRGDVRLSYRLNIRPERLDFHLFLLPDAPNRPDSVTVPAGGRALATVLAVRSDGFDGPVRVEAVDLPAGVRCEPVVIPVGQPTAPIVFEADEGARPSLGTVRLIGRARFGDRKDEVDYVAGVTRLGPDLTRESLGGGVVWALPNAQLQPQNQAMAPARLTRGFVLKVSDPSPLTLSVRAGSRTVTPGGLLSLELTVTRREGFSEAVAVSPANALVPVRNNNQNQAGNAQPAVTIPKGETTGTYPLTIPRTLGPGVYTLVLQGTGPYPFSKDPNAKTKPNVTLGEPSNPLTIVVRPAPATVAVKSGGAIKPGGRLEVEVTVTRKDGLNEPVVVSLAAPPALKLAAEPVRAEPGKAVKLVISSSADSPNGAAAGLAVRAVVPVRGEAVEVNEPLTVNIAK
jgi:hypothetical protein